MRVLLTFTTRIPYNIYDSTDSDVWSNVVDYRDRDCGQPERGG